VGARGYSNAPAVHYKTDAIKAWNWTKSDWIVIAKLTRSLTLDRADRLEMMKHLDPEVQMLRSTLATSEQDRADRLKVIEHLDAEVQMLRSTLATSKQDRADRLKVIGHLKARLHILQKEMQARKHPLRRWCSRALTLVCR